MNKIEFSLLQYRHHLSLKEIVNIGFVLYQPATGNIAMVKPDNLDRLISLYPNEVKYEYLMGMLTALQIQFNSVQIINGSLDKIIKDIYPINDSSMTFLKATKGLLYDDFDKEVVDLTNFHFKYYKK